MIKLYLHDNITYMKEYEKILKALANRRRLQILKYLKNRKSATVTSIAEHLKLSLKSTSKHLAVLFGASIVDREQNNLSMLYSISDILPPLAKQVINII
jgi:DNA-binding transcriptional ArsR family regulator